MEIEKRLDNIEECLRTLLKLNKLSQEIDNSRFNKIEKVLIKLIKE